MAISTSSDQALTLESLSFPGCNHLARIGVDPKHPEYNDVCWFFQRSPLQYALTAKPKMSKFLLGNFWLTCSFDEETQSISASVLSNEEPDVIFNKEDVRDILRLPTFSSYEDFPIVEAHQQVISALNYSEEPKTSSKYKGPKTLLKSKMGNIWSFFFSHLINCLSKKTGGLDQSPSYITDLAHALIFQRKIDFAEYFFKEMVSSFSVMRRPQVPFQRFFSLIINHKLAAVLKNKDDIEYDLEVRQIGHGVLSKKPLPSDNPLRKQMIELARNATLS